ncbi:MAG: efflux RND transporter permease subunit [Spirochaetaceae bacterium]|nr:efflux RND transporter permease subunit [Spirochaetaceae bacterium]
MNFSGFAVKHPAVIAMILIVLVVFGMYFVLDMNVEFIGDMSLPSVIVISTYPGAGAEQVEQEVTAILENDFVTLPDFRTVTSSSMNSVSMITLTFADGINPYDQLPEVRNRISRLMESLPDGLSGEPWSVVGGASMMPIFTFSVEGGQDTARVTEYIKDEIIPKITRISGVSEVELSGGKELQVLITLRLDDLVSKKISVTNVYQSLSYGNVNLPIGTADYESRTIGLRYAGGFSSIEDIKNLPVGSAGTQIIHLSDVADVQLDYPAENVYITDGERSITTVSVSKRQDGNTVSIVKQIKEVLREVEATTNKALTFNIVSDDSNMVKSSLSTVIRSGVGGIIMAVLVIFLFLADTKATLIIALSIPLSILFTFLGMKLFGLSINLMSLSGIVVALGMVVDGSIVMLEQVYRYYGHSSASGQISSATKSVVRFSKEAAIKKGASEVTSAILASTATTVVVFVPIAMLTGIIGMILKDMAVTIVCALIASFFVAVLVVPFFMKVLLKEDPTATSIHKKERKFDIWLGKIERWYKNALKWCINNRKYILVVSVCVLVLTILIAGALGLTFIPSTDSGDFYLNLDFSKGTKIDQTDRKMRQAYEIIKENVPEVQNAVYYTGRGQSGFMSSASENQGYVHVILVPVSQRKRDIHEIMVLVQELISAQIPDVTVSVENGGFDKLLSYVSGGGGYGLTLEGEDLNLLYETALRIQKFMEQDSDVLSVKLDTTFDTSTMVIDMSQESLSSLGISSYEAGITSAILFRGLDTGVFNDTDNDKNYTIRIESDKTGKAVTFDDIANVHLITPTGDSVSLSNLADIHVDESVSQINHTNRSKTITITARTRSEDTAGLNSRVKAYIKKNPLPQGVKSSEGGLMELITDAIPPMISALCISLFLLYTVMVLQFERFRQPLLIMVSIPFCIIGVIVGLLMFGSSMNLVAMLGVIALGGIVVNNGIILIDYMNQLRAQKRCTTVAQLEETIITGASTRIKPIAMTTLTTMLGVVPMAIARGEGSEVYAPLGQAIAGGLLTSTLITLFIIPVLYYVTEKRHLDKVDNGTRLNTQSAEDNRRNGRPQKSENKQNPEKKDRPHGFGPLPDCFYK